MDALSSLKVQTDTTLRLIREAATRQHELYYYQPSALSFSEGKILAHAYHLSMDPDGTVMQGAEKRLLLNEMDLILMRQDPPFDMSYITACYMLEYLHDHVWVMNHPSEVRNHPEKWMPLHFPELTPATIVSSDHSDFANFLTKHEDIVLKPLYAHGGAGVLRVRRGHQALEDALGEMHDHYGLPCIAQPFLPEVMEGDKRILLLNGEVMGGFLRTPPKGGFITNTAAGGGAQPIELNARDKEICAALKPMLQEKGLFFVGIDVIGRYLTEVNVTSPTGFAWLEKLYDQQPAVEFWDAVEKQWQSHAQISLAK